MIGLEELARLTGTSVEQAGARLTRSRRHYEMMRPWLPVKCASFLDVGCGLGGIAAWVACHYPGATAHLLDGAEAGEKWGGLREDGEPWTDVHLAARLFMGHCPGRACVMWTPERVARDGFGDWRFDLVYSCCAWGHHFPIKAYLDRVAGAMKEEATLIVDLRLGETGDRGAELLGHQFALVNGEVHVGKKYRRTVWRRRGCA